MLFLFQSVIFGIEISYPVSEVHYRYGTPSKNLPDLNKLKEAYVSFEGEENKEFNLGAYLKKAKQQQMEGKPSRSN